MNKSVFCVARDEVKAVRILDDLKAAGFSESRISVLIPEKAIQGGFSHAPEITHRGTAQDTPRTGLLGGILDQLVDVGILTDMKFGRVIGAGPLMASLSAPQRQEVERAVLCEPQGPAADWRAEDCPPYLRFLNEGKILVSVASNSAEEISRIESILFKTGGDEILTTECGDVPGDKSSPRDYSAAA